MDMEAEAFKALAEKYQAQIAKMEKEREWKREHYNIITEWVDILEETFLEVVDKGKAAQAIKKKLDSFPLRFDEEETEDDPRMVRIKAGLIRRAEESLDIK